MGFPGGARSVNAGDRRDMASTLGSGRFPGARNGSLLRMLASKIPWTEEPDRLQYMGPQRVRYD